MSASQLQPTTDRIRGVQQAHADLGLAWDERLLIRFKTSMSFDADLMRMLMESPDRPDAFLCLGTHILSGVIGVLRSMQIAFPGDVSLVSVGDSDFPRYYNPTISAIAWDPNQVVDHFTRAILQLADAPSRELVPCEFLARESS